MSTTLNDVTPGADTLTAPQKTTQTETSQVETTQIETLQRETAQITTSEQVTLHQPKPRKSATKTKVKETKRVTGEEKQSRISSGVDWPIAIWIGVIHLGALAAPFTFSWEGLGTFFFLSWVTGSIGICMTFHRMLTHRSFKTSKPMWYFLAWLGQMAGEGSAVHWVANHRKHHAHSDQEGDPHSPFDGGWWSHMIWFMWARTSENYAAHNKRWAPDLADDKILLFLDRTFILWHVLFASAMFGVGYAFSGAYMGWSLVVWGMFLRLCFVLHATWLVNSASHMWGYRTYETTDDSRNNWWVALLTYGEGWHNNHHAYPTMARAGHRWWEIDTTFWIIKGMEKCGLIWDVVDGQHKKENKVAAKK